MASTTGDQPDPRQTFCDQLRSIDVDAHPAEDVNPGDQSERHWLIEVANSPIGHILLADEYTSGGSAGAADSASRSILYLAEVPETVGNPVAGSETEDATVEWRVVRGDSWTDEERVLGDVPGFADALAKHAPSRIQWEEYESLAREQLAMPRLGTRAWTEAECAALNEEAGISANVLEQDPFTAAASEIWIEIADSPISWVACGDPDSRSYDERDFENLLYVPDPRITQNFPQLSLEPRPIKSFPLFWRIKGVRWTLDNIRGNSMEEFSLQVAASLDENQAIADGFLHARPLGVFVRTDPSRGCWVISQAGLRSLMAHTGTDGQGIWGDSFVTFDTPWGMSVGEWEQRLWSCYEEIAKLLRATPAPPFSNRDG